MQVKEAMVARENLVTASPFNTLKDVMEKMVEQNVGSVIITDSKTKVVGIVTTHDIMNGLLGSENSGFKTKINKIMSKHLVTVLELDPLNSAIQKLQESNIHHLIVITQEGKLAGILSSLDIVRERSLDIKAYPWIRK